MAKKLTLKEWTDDNKPREKLLKVGIKMMSDAELLAIIMGSGSRDETAVDLAIKIMKDNNSNISEVSRLQIKDLMKYKGIGLAKAISIISAFELGRRSFFGDINRSKILDSESAFQLMYALLSGIMYEEFWVVYLNNSNMVLAKKKIAQGGITSTTVDLRLIYSIALEQHSTAILLYHNHPSGNINPSESDIQLTKKIVEAGKLLDIKVLDHLIIGEKNFYSFADKGLI
jgi:DNA repair protein RadC